MKTRSKSTCLIRGSLALALALCLSTPLTAGTDEPGEVKAKGEPKMMEHCREMSEHRQKLMAEIKAQDIDLSEQVARMNRAQESKKLEMLADIVSKMVDQRSIMNSQHAALEAEMMQHMMQHMQMGKESTMQCPMMKGMHGLDEKSDEHKDHHAEPK